MCVLVLDRQSLNDLNESHSLERLAFSCRSQSFNNCTMSTYCVLSMDGDNEDTIAKNKDTNKGKAAMVSAPPRDHGPVERQAFS